MLVIAGTARIDPARRAAALEASREMIAATRREAGCVAYRFGFDLDDPAQVHIFEQWESAEALASHFATPHMAQFMTRMAGVLAGPPELLRYEIASVGPLAM